MRIARKLCIALMLIVSLVPFAVMASGQQEAPTSEDGRSQVIFYVFDDPLHHVLVDSFNSSQDEIYVDARFIPASEYETKITTLLAARAEMDAFMQKRMFDVYPQYNNGYLEPLDNLIATLGIDTTAIEKYKESATLDGKTIGFPWRGANELVFYNKVLFEKAGIPTPDVYVENGTWTWEKFHEVSKAIASGDGDIYGASVYTWPDSQLVMQAQSYKQLISSDGTLDGDSQYLAWLKLAKAMEEDGSMWPLIDTKVSKIHYSKQFSDGRVGMLLQGVWFPDFLNTARRDNLLKGFSWDDWGVTRLPSNEAEYATYGIPTLNHVTSYAKNKEGAIKFLAWMAGPEGAKIAAKSGVLPAVVTPEVKELLAPNFPDKKSLEYFTEDVRVFPIMMDKYGSRVTSLVGGLTEEYLLGKWTSDEAFMEHFNKQLKDIAASTR